MTSFKERVLLDRYAVKDSERKLEIRDMVVVSLQRKFDQEARDVESREIGHVHDYKNGVYDIQLVNEQKEIVYGIPHSKLEYCVEQSYADICHRVAKAAALGDQTFEDDIFRIMQAERFVPGGRILAGIGRQGQDLTLFNCYVYGIDSDSRAGISRHWARLFETYSRGGGVGWNLSILRPRGAVVKKANGRSSGSVSWAEQFSQITETVEQGGSRRGAGLQGLEVWHPDILRFIDVKAQREEFKAPDGQVISRNKNLLRGSNISVLITSGFMEAVEKNASWDLVFPDLTDPEYDNKWDGDLGKWQGLDKKVDIYQTVPARDLWNRIIQRAWESGEPGIIFLDRCNEMSNSWYYTRITATNPCGEQALSPNSVCNLGHLNLAKFVDVNKQLPAHEATAEEASKNFQWAGFTAAIYTGIRFLDQVIDLNSYHEKAIEEQQTSERRVGLGILGYSEMLIHLGLRYGSEEALKFTNKLMKHFSTQSYITSAELAKTKGPFPLYDSEKFLASGFMKQHTQAARKAVAEHGIRNVTLNSIAPTGSVSALMQTSGGCEPFFSLEYTSTTRIGVVKEQMLIVQKLADQFGVDRSNWPEYVVTAQKGITPLEHVKTQGAFQRWIDASISKTTNLPTSATVADIAEVYEEMWKVGCKGGTVYRNNSRDEQVLYVESDEVEVEVVDESEDTAVILPRPEVGHSVTFSEESPIGTVHATLRHDPISSEPLDLFLTVSKGDVSADAEAIGRLISVILRWPNTKKVSQQTRLEIIRDQLVDILGRGQVGYGPQAKRSLPDTVAKIINKYLAADFPMAHLPMGKSQMQNLLYNLKKLSDSPEELKYFVDVLLDEEPNGEDEKESAEHEEYQKKMLEEIHRAEESGIELPRDVCTYCGNVTMVLIPGKCGFCSTCGKSLC